MDGMSPNEREQYLLRDGWFFGLTAISLVIVLFVSSINWIVCLLSMTSFVFVNFVFISKTPEVQSLSFEYTFNASILTIFMCYLNFHQIKRSKIQFLTKLKIQRLLNEQSNIIDTMPQGSIIYQVPSSNNNDKDGNKGEKSHV